MAERTITEIFEGEGFFGEEQKIQTGKLIIFSEGDFLRLKQTKVVSDYF